MCLVLVSVVPCNNCCCCISLINRLAGKTETHTDEMSGKLFKRLYTSQFKLHLITFIITLIFTLH